jgi:hypothetical protein
VARVECGETRAGGDFAALNPGERVIEQAAKAKPVWWAMAEKTITLSDIRASSSFDRRR